MIPDNNKSNDYKVGERTQVKFCFTVGGKDYATLLVNTIDNANFESTENFIVWSNDESASEVLNRYDIPYIENYSKNIYIAKGENIIRTSILFQNTLIIAVDVLSVFDFKDCRGIFGRLTYKDSLYAFSDEHITPSDSFGIHGFCIMSYNANSETLKTYDFIKNLLIEGKLEKLSSHPDYERESYKKRFGTDVVEEDILMQMSNIIIDDKKLLPRLLRGIYHSNFGHNIMKRIKEENRNYISGYYIQDKYLKELTS